MPGTGARGGHARAVLYWIVCFVFEGCLEVLSSMLTAGKVAKRVPGHTGIWVPGFPGARVPGPWYSLSLMAVVAACVVAITSRYCARIAVDRLPRV